jgi:hypothetical protein
LEFSSLGGVIPGKPPVPREIAQDIPRYFISSLNFLSLPIEPSFREGPLEGPSEDFTGEEKGLKP